MHVVFSPSCHWTCLGDHGVIGPKGETGIDGAPGVDGREGAPGINGTDGQRGKHLAHQNTPFTKINSVNDSISCPPS